MQGAGLSPERARVGGNVHGMLLEGGEWNDLERALISAGEDDVGRRAVFVRAQPVQCGHAPTVAWLEAREAVLRHRTHQVVADPALVLEERRRHDRAYCVASPILGAATTAPVAIEAGNWLEAARFQPATEYVAIGHDASIAEDAARG
jgi:hypothetical protein